MLRDYPSGEERRITAEHARLFISAAPIGSVIRLQAVLEGADSVSCNRHSMILLDKTETGATFYHDWSGYATISTLSWAQFENNFRTEIDFGYFKYIKYPAAKALKFEYTGSSAVKEMVVTSRMYGAVELVATKR